MPDGSRGSVKLALLAGAALTAAVSGMGTLLLGCDGPVLTANAGAPVHRVRRGNLRITLKRKGTFAAEKAISVRPHIRGSAKIVWLVDNGKTVKKGDVLLELDKTELEEQIEQYESQIEKFIKDVSAATAQERISQLESKTKTDGAILELEMAKLEIDKFEEGQRPKEVRDAQIKIDQAKVTLLRATAEYARMPEMLKQGFVTKEEVEQSKLDVDTARNALRTAELEHEILTKYTHPMQSRRLASKKTQAEDQVERSRQEAKEREASTGAVKGKWTLELARGRRRLAEAQDRLRKMTIRAGGDGIVVYGSGRRSRWRREDPLKVGGAVYNNQVVMRLPNLNTMQVIAEIHEADINKVRVDDKSPQQVLITSDNRPGKTFEGYVKAVDTLAQSHWYKENVKYFLVTIGLKKQIVDLRPGTTAAVEIFVRQVDNVLIVPIQAVDTVRGKSYCYMAGGGEKREVAIGASSHTMAEIKSGLEEGETILLEQADGASNGEEEDEEGDDSAPEGPPKQATPRRGKGRRNRSK